MKIMVLDQSGLAFDRWYSIPGGTSPELEKRDFLREYAKKLYTLVNMFQVDEVWFALDSKVGYWRSDVYDAYYRKHCKVGVDVGERVWLFYDNAKYVIAPSGFNGEHIKVKPKKDSDYLGSEPGATVPLGNFLLDPEVAQELKDLAKEHAPAYKGSRKKREWVHTTSQSIWHELRHDSALMAHGCFPGKVIYVPRAEADDGAFEAVDMLAEGDEIVLVSADGDWDQLVRPGVTRYDFQKQSTTEGSSQLGMESLKVKLLGGDTSDCISGIARPGKSNCVAAAGAKTLLMEYPGTAIRELAKSEGWLEQLKLNRTLMQLGMAPEDIRKQLREQVEAPAQGRTDLMGLERFGLTKSEIHQIRLQTAVLG